LRLAFENKKLGVTLLLSLLAHASAAILFYQTGGPQHLVRTIDATTASTWLEVSTAPLRRQPRKIPGFQNRSSGSLHLPSAPAPDDLASASSIAANETKGGEREPAASASALGIDVIYPRLSRVLREEGTVLIELNPEGPGSRLIKSSGHQRLDAAALAALKSFKPTASQARIVEFEFKLR
jgi:TonB family protein